MPWNPRRFVPIVRQELPSLGKVWYKGRAYRLVVDEFTNRWGQTKVQLGFIGADNMFVVDADKITRTEPEVAAVAPAPQSYVPDPEVGF